MALAVAFLTAAPVNPTRAGTGQTSFVSDIRVVNADSQDAAYEQLESEGYIVVENNLAEQNPDLSSRYVYLGYKTTTDSARAITGTGSDATGSVFSSSNMVMFGGFGVIVGLIAGMLSMKIGRSSGKNDEDDEFM
ncbi:MAG: hypothetical protein K5840_04715 [Eubacterium sp.]|nr:hypothetical protein [Eubacterium sp.]